MTISRRANACFCWPRGAGIVTLPRVFAPVGAVHEGTVAKVAVVRPGTGVNVHVVLIHLGPTLHFGPIHATDSTKCLISRETLSLKVKRGRHFSHLIMSQQHSVCNPILFVADSLSRSHLFHIRRADACFCSP